MTRTIAALLLASAIIGCGAEVDPGGDAGLDRSDAGSRDGGTIEADSGAPPPLDAGAPPPVDAGGADSGADAGALCPPPLCDAPPPTYDPMEDWRHPVASAFTTGQGAARHRGRDLVLRESDAQWVIGKLAYGFADDDLEDEDVDVYLLRGCGGAWEHLGTATTTDDDETPHATIERVEDDGGRVYFEIPAADRLAVGRHRVHLVVRGDHSSADMFIDVLGGDERYVVTDVDGTLTDSETAEWSTVFSGPSPTVRPGAPEALWALANRGYRIFYLTARPDWLTTRTHEWIAEPAVALPPGIVHTTLGGTGALGGAAITFKTEEIAELSARVGEPPVVAIGNTDTDAEAYATEGVDPTRRYLYQLDGDAMGGVHVDDYFAIVPELEALPLACF